MVQFSATGVYVMIVPTVSTHRNGRKVCPCYRSVAWQSVCLPMIHQVIIPKNQWRFMALEMRQLTCICTGLRSIYTPHKVYHFGQRIGALWYSPSPSRMAESRNLVYSLVVLMTPHNGNREVTYVAVDCWLWPEPTRLVTRNICSGDQMFNAGIKL